MKFRSSLYLLLAVGRIALAGDVPVPPDGAASAKSHYEESIDKARRQYESAIADALGKFDALISKAKSDGKLDVVLALKEEKDRASQSAPLGTLLPDAVAARQAFDASRQKAKSDYETHAREIHAAFLRDLDQLAILEIDANRFESAKAIRNYRNGVEQIGPALLSGPASAPSVAPARRREFGWRFGQEKARLVKSEGGTEQSEAAVAAGLVWLAKQQKPDGSWELPGNARRIPATGLALLAFMGAGYTHRTMPDEADRTRAKYPSQIDKGLKYLLGKQTRSGDFNGENLYDQAIAAMALCEAYGMTADPRIHNHAQSAIDYIVKAQHSAGGWRYAPGQAGDTSVTGWQLQAIRSARLAGLKVPRDTLTKVSSFLDSVAGGNPVGATYGYVNQTGSPSMTAVGLFSRDYLGWQQKNPAQVAGIEELKKVPPRDVRDANDTRSIDHYYYYYATQVVHRYGGSDWSDFWNPRMRDWLLSLQVAGNSPNAGSWSPDSTISGTAGGRLFATSMSVLTLEVYYRFLLPEKEVVKQGQ